MGPMLIGWLGVLAAVVAGSSGFGSGFSSSSWRRLA
jgi:hypothetical protein